MRTRSGVVAGVLLVGAVAWGQAPAEKKVDEVARLKARLEVAELAREVDKAVLKESLLLVKRTERDLPLARNRPEREEKLQNSLLQTLKHYVEVEQKRFEDQAVELEAMRRQVAKVARFPQPASPAQAALRPSPKDLEERDGQAEETGLNLELLQAELNLVTGSLTEHTTALAALEVGAADPQAKGDEAVRKELVAGRTRYDEVRRRYLDLRKKLAREERTLNELRPESGGSR